MLRKIKILESTCTPDLEKDINKMLKKGWNIRGSITVALPK